jgi:hypothetical protein
LNDVSELPQLAIVPVESLKLHEYNDEQRTPRLIKKLYANGVLRNPPIVIPMRQLTESYLVLDGANRLSAFRRMDIPHILVQIVQIDDPNLELNSWNHILWGIPPDHLFNNLHKVPGIMLQPSTPATSFQDLMDIHTLVSIHLPNGSVFTAFTPSADLIDRVAAINRVVERYIKIARLDRTTAFQIKQLCHLYDN